MLENRDFVYNIPGKVLFDSNLKLCDLKVYMIIRSFMDTTGAAYPSNGWLAERLGVSYKSASRSLNKLAKFKHIEIIERNGRRYCVIGQPIPVDIVSPRCADESVKGVDTDVQGGGHRCPGGVDTDVHQLDQRSITSKIINNVLSQNDLKIIFDKLWEHYPVKKAKQAALKALTKVVQGKGRIEAEKLVEQICNGFKAHLQEHAAKESVKAQGADIWVSQLPHLSTWINQCRWEDEYQSPEDVLRTATRKKPGLDLSAIELQWKNK